MSDEAGTTAPAQQEQQQKYLSVEIAKLFSYNQADKAILKISLWNGKIGLDFSKMVNGSQKRSFITIDYEKAIYLSGIFNSILRERVTAYKTGAPYKALDIAIDQSFPDKESGELRKNGVLKIKTVPVANEKTGKEIQRIAISYEAMGEIYDVVMCSRIISKQISEKYTEKEIDPDDVRFIYLCRTWEGLVSNIPTVFYVAKIAELILNKPNYSNKGSNNFNNGSGKKWNNGGDKEGSNVRQFRPAGDSSQQRRSVTDDSEEIAF